MRRSRAGGQAPPPPPPPSWPPPPPPKQQLGVSPKSGSSSSSATTTHTIAPPPPTADHAHAVTVTTDVTPAAVDDLLMPPGSVPWPGGFSGAGGQQQQPPPLHHHHPGWGGPSPVHPHHHGPPPHHRHRPPPPPPRGGGVVFFDRALLYALSAAVFVLLALVARVQPEFGYVHERRHVFRSFLYAHAKDYLGEDEVALRVPLDVIHVDELNTTKFFTRMYRNEPFIIEGAAHKLPAFDKWVGPSADDYLRTTAGDTTMEVESSKDGHFAEFMPGWHRQDVKFSEFLDRYRGGGAGKKGGGGGGDGGVLNRKGDKYMYLAEHDIPESLLGDVPFYDFTSFLDVNQEDVSRKIWLAHNKGIGGGSGGGGGDGFSKATVGVGNPVVRSSSEADEFSGGGEDEEDEDEDEPVDHAFDGKKKKKKKKHHRKKNKKKPQSLPHTDNFENILVQLEGAKELVIVPPTHGLFLYPGGWSDEAGKFLPPHYSPVNFHDPDRLRHPKFSQCDPINIRLEAGDALYLPAYWWHHVKPGTNGRNLAVNFWYPTVSAMFRLAMDGMENNAI